MRQVRAELRREPDKTPTVKDARRNFDKPDRKEPALLRRQLIGELVRLRQLGKEGARIASLAKTEPSAWGPAWAEALQAEGMDPWYASRLAGSVGDYVRRLSRPPPGPEGPALEVRESVAFEIALPTEPRYRDGVDSRSWRREVRDWVAASRAEGSRVLKALKQHLRERKSALLEPRLHILGFTPEGPPPRSRAGRAGDEPDWRVTETAKFLLGLRKSRTARIQEEREGLPAREEKRTAEIRGRAVRTILDRVGLKRSPRKGGQKRG